MIIAEPGVAKGLPKNPATVPQSRAKEPMPRPWRAEPICWAVTDFGQIQQMNEREVMEGKRKLGTM